MSRYFLSISNSTGLQVRTVQSADADDLQRRVRVAIGELSVAIAGGNLLACNLSGEGDGPSYTVELTAIGPNQGGTVVVYPEGSPPADSVIVIPLTLVTATCYMAQTRDQIELQRTRALAESGVVVTTFRYDEMQAGGSKGLRVMGLVLHAPTGP